MSGVDVLFADELALLSRQLGEKIVGRVGGANAYKALHANRMLADRGFEEIASAVRPAPNQLALVDGVFILRRPAV